MKPSLVVTVTWGDGATTVTVTAPLLLLLTVVLPAQPVTVASFLLCPLTIFERTMQCLTFSYGWWFDNCCLTSPDGDNYAAETPASKWVCTDTTGAGD